MGRADARVLLLLLGAVIVIAVLIVLNITLTGPLPRHSSSFVGPFHIKANDALGIKLGMSLAEYSKARPHDFRDCYAPEADNTVSCMPIPVTNSNEITIGQAKAYSCRLMFYRQHLIEIQYQLTSLDWETLLTAMKEKFGNPDESGLRWTWNNSVSTMQLDRSGSDYTAATLDLSLSKERHDWLIEYEQYQKAKARKEL